VPLRISTHSGRIVGNSEGTSKLAMSVAHTVAYSLPNVPEHPEHSRLSLGLTY
jgi:hypothetical protein